MSDKLKSLLTELRDVDREIEGFDLARFVHPHDVIAAHEYRDEILAGIRRTNV